MAAGKYTVRIGRLKTPRSGDMHAVAEAEIKGRDETMIFVDLGPLSAFTRTMQTLGNHMRELERCMRDFGRAMQ